MLKIALPNKGSLSEDAVRLCLDAGYKCRRVSRELMISDTYNDIEFVFLRPRDIAVYVSNGILDMGITGRDLSVDSRANVKEILNLGFAKSSFHYAVPEKSTLIPEDLNGKVIATSYPNLVKLDLEKKGVKADVVKLDGAIEISIRMGVADAIADVVQTGRTMKEAGLKITGSPVMESEAILISGNNNNLDDVASRTFMDRLRGIVVARNYVMLEYDIPEDRLEDACFISPGIEAPTISPLSKKGWHAVKSMTKKKHVNSIMDELYEIGAKGIIVTEIKNSRL